MFSSLEGGNLSDTSALVNNLLEIGTLYHNMLFSYQRALRFHLGERSNMYIHPTISHLLEMDEEGGLKLNRSKNFEEAVSAFADFLTRSNIVRQCTLESMEEDRYVFRVEGCIWSGKVHNRQVSLKNVTCPYALVIMALYKKFKGQAANETESEYFSNGTETPIEPATIY